MIGKILGGLFAVLCVGASFGGGNAFQSNQATVQLSSLFGIEGGRFECFFYQKRKSTSFSKI